ncbi:MAG: helix-turn-helix domain-containing protein [Thiohalobacterales bacterium]|nr:helix-turn-helix domain-containing protein [Thiohalobacterales bacterium]
MSSKDPETRTRILEAAVQLLEAQAGKTVRMADIARAAGISRQAVYLHFASRAELLAAATRYLDDRLGLDQRLARSRAAASGTERLDAYIEFWGNYIPKIHGVARALLVAQEADEAAAAAWNERMAAMRDGCRAAIVALQADGALSAGWSRREATDVLWTLLSVRNWEQLTQGCGWSSRKYIRRMQVVARRVFVDDRHATAEPVK